MHNVCAGLGPATQVNKRIRSDQIDILIDLGGHTGNTQIGIMALCPAPIQVAALSTPGDKSGALPPEPFLSLRSTHIPPGAILSSPPPRHTSRFKSKV